MKRAFIVFVSVLLVIGVTSCNSLKEPKTTIQTTTDVTLVCITDNGECYHRDYCFCLRKSRHTITLTDAIHKGYRACQHCEPPIA